MFQTLALVSNRFANFQPTPAPLPLQQACLAQACYLSQQTSRQATTRDSFISLLIYRQLSNPPFSRR